MLKQLAKVLQKKYPNLQIDNPVTLINCIDVYFVHYDATYWVLDITESTIRNSYTTYSEGINISPSHPDYFQKIDELLCYSILKICDTHGLSYVLRSHLDLDDKLIDHA